MPVVPVVGNHGVAVTAHDGLQRQFDRQIEMMGEQGLQTGDHGAPVQLERVGDVIAGDEEQ